MVATVTYSLQTIQSQFQANSWEDQNQLAPDVLGLANGGYVFAYNNADIDNGFILVDFYNAAGANFGYSIPYTVDGGDTFGSTDAVGAPSLTQLSNGNVVVVWADANATSPGIRATIFDENGGVVTSEFTVTPFSTDRVPQVTALEGGGFVATYQISGGTVLAVVYDDAGNITTGEFVVNTTNGTETEPAIAALADGGFVATWTYDDGSGNLVVKARIFNANGTPRTVNGSTDDFVVGAFGDNSQPAVAALPNGNWAVVYTDSGWADEDVGITLTIMGPNGEVVNSFAKANDSTDPENEFDPDVTVLANGFIVVSWTYPFNPGVDDDIYFRIFDQNGIPVSINGYSGVQVLDASFDDDVASAVSSILAGQFVAAWQDTATDGSDGQITASVHELVRTTEGDGASEVLNGDALRDIVNGNGGNDTLNGGEGDDTLNGGSGIDSAVFAGARAAYTLTNLGAGNVRVVGTDGDDMVSAVEKLVFDDALLNWQPANGGDFNADAFGDVLFRNTGNGTVATWELNGAGAFGFDNYGAANLAWQQVAADDFNADGKGDILFRNTSTGQVATWELNGSGGFSFQGYGAASLAWQSVGSGDFNADGIGDVLYRNTATGQVATWELNGSGGFSFDLYGAANLVWKIAGIGDFNADGKDDILWRNSSTGAVQTWELNGAGGFSADSYGAANLVWHIFGVGDFNADGKDDILWRNDSTGAVQTWELNGGGGFSADSYGAAGSQWTIMQATDTNSDGKDDVLWRNTTTGQVAAWELNGAGSFSFQSYGAASLAWEVFDGNFQFV